MVSGRRAAPTVHAVRPTPGAVGAGTIGFVAAARGQLDRATIGWREWAALPDLDVAWIKTKIDTGARSSALHAFDLDRFQRGGRPWVRFEIHPWQRSDHDAIEVEAAVTDTRTVRSSNGVSERRPVITTTVRLGDRDLAVDLTLTRRDQMGFRLLIGRQALRGRYLVDPERSFTGGHPPRAIRRANRARRRP